MTLDRLQRNAVRSEVLIKLDGTDRFTNNLRDGDYAAAQATGEVLADSIALLDDLGWQPHDSRDTFQLALPGDQLARALRRLQHQATEALADHLSGNSIAVDDHHLEKVITAGWFYAQALAALQPPAGRRRKRPR